MFSIMKFFLPQTTNLYQETIQKRQLWWIQDRNQLKNFPKKLNSQQAKNARKTTNKAGTNLFIIFKGFFSRNDQAWISGCWPKRSTKDFFLIKKLTFELFLTISGDRIAARLCDHCDGRTIHALRSALSK